MFKTNCPIDHSRIDKIRFELIFTMILCALPLLHGLELVIPDDTTVIAADQYKNNTEITSVVIPNSVATIGNGAFFGCSNLQCIRIPDSVTTIGREAFSGCSSLKSITIPNGVTSIDYAVFAYCHNLTNIVIPNSVTSIGENAFFDCNALANITLPDSVTTIGNRAFKGCMSLTSLLIPDGVTSIGMQAFSGCSSLTSLTIPASVRSTYTSCFEYCTSLKTLTINCEGTKFTLDTNPINRLDSLTDVIFNKGMPKISWTFGTSKPVVHGSTTWNGYEFRDVSVDQLEGKTISLLPTNGKIGQVLMVTANGYEWKDVSGGSSTAFPDKFHLDAGWNLISLPDAELTASCKAELLKAYYFFSFDQNAKNYVRAHELLPRACYWVFVKDACTIHFTKAE